MICCTVSFYPFIALSGACKPVRQRPMTTDMVARRLVHGALGVKGPPRTAAQREVERNMLQAVRSKLLLTLFRCISYL